MQNLIIAHVNKPKHRSVLLLYILVDVSSTLTSHFIFSAYLQSKRLQQNLNILSRIRTGHKESRNIRKKSREVESSVNEEPKVNQSLLREFSCHLLQEMTETNTPNRKRNATLFFFNILFVIIICQSKCIQMSVIRVKHHHDTYIN